MLRLLIFICLSNTIWANSFSLNNDIFQNSNQDFISHQGSGPWSNYLAMTINYGPVRNLFTKLDRVTKRPLKKRGEAHITVITPIEYFHILKKKKITMDQIEQIALENNIQEANFEVLCLGQGSARIKVNEEESEEENYFIVVKSPKLLDIRKKIQVLYISKGGEPEDFRPSHYYPHITLGFTERDLHESDKVIKGTNSCWADLHLF
jgi:hypothetical protein